MIAPFGDLEIGRRARRGNEPRKKVVFGFGLQFQSYGSAPGACFIEHLHDRRICARTDDAVDLGDQRA